MSEIVLGGNLSKILEIDRSLAQSPKTTWNVLEMTHRKLAKFWRFGEISYNFKAAKGKSKRFYRKCRKAVKWQIFSSLGTQRNLKIFMGKCQKRRAVPESFLENSPNFEGWRNCLNFKDVKGKSKKFNNAWTNASLRFPASEILRAQCLILKIWGKAQKFWNYEMLWLLGDARQGWFWQSLEKQFCVEIFRPFSKFFRNQPWRASLA